VERGIGALWKHNAIGLPERFPTDELPAVSLSAQCTQPAATALELAAWIAPGSTTAAFPDVEALSFTRECHALTGCTAWVEESGALLAQLVTLEKGLAVRSAFGEDFVLVDGRYEANGYEIVVGAGCARGSALRSQAGPHSNATERFGSAVSIRPPSPGNQ
jgi:hypothetical protein